MAAPPPVNRAHKKGVLGSPDITLDAFNLDPDKGAFGVDTLTKLENVADETATAPPKIDRSRKKPASKEEKKEKAEKKKEEKAKKKEMKTKLKEEKKKAKQSPKRETKKKKKGKDDALGFGAFGDNTSEFEAEPSVFGMDDEEPKDEGERRTVLGKLMKRQPSNGKLKKGKKSPDNHLRVGTQISSNNLLAYKGSGAPMSADEAADLGESLLEETLPDTAEEFFAMMDGDLPPEKDLPKPTRGTTNAADKSKYIFDLQIFYHKMDPDRDDAEERARALLNKYPPGNVAIALESKYGEIPVGWDDLLEKARLTADRKKA